MVPDLAQEMFGLVIRVAIFREEVFEDIKNLFSGLLAQPKSWMIYWQMRNCLRNGVMRWYIVVVILIIVFIIAVGYIRSYFRSWEYFSLIPSLIQ